MEGEGKRPQLGGPMKRIIPLGATGIAAAVAVAFAAEDRELSFPANYKTDYTLYYTGDRYF